MQGTGFDQWFRKIPHAVEQLNRSTTITEDHVLQSPSAATPEPEGPRTHALQQEKPLQ